MRKRGWLYLFGLTIASAAPTLWALILHAQGPAPLEPGVRIRVTVHISDSRQRLAGTMVRMNGDSVVLRTDNRQTQTFATADVRKLEVSVKRPRSTWRGVLIGTAVGAAVGAGTGATADNSCPAGEPCFRMKYSRTTDILGSAMFIGAVGGIIGGGVGALIHHDVWRDSTVLLKR